MDGNKLARIILDGQFREAKWKHLTLDERLEACQMLENRLARERNATPRTIELKRMEEATFGYQSGDKIYINAHLLERDELPMENGFARVPAAGWQVYDTICHEDVHGMLEDRGAGQTISYIPAGNHDELYRIQFEEKYAFAVGQDRTLTAILEQKEIHGLEPDMIDYKNVAKQDRFQDRADEASRLWGIPNVDKKLEQLTQDKEHGITPTMPDPDYQRLDNALYGAHHPLSDNESEGEGTPGHGQMPMGFGSGVYSEEGQDHYNPFESNGGQGTWGNEDNDRENQPLIQQEIGAGSDLYKEYENNYGLSESTGGQGAWGSESEDQHTQNYGSSTYGEFEHQNDYSSSQSTASQGAWGNESQSWQQTDEPVETEQHGMHR